MPWLPILPGDGSWPDAPPPPPPPPTPSGRRGGVNRHSPGCGCCGGCSACVAAYIGLPLLIDFTFEAYPNPFGPQATVTATYTLTPSGSTWTTTETIDDYNAFYAFAIPWADTERLRENRFTFGCVNNVATLIHRASLPGTPGLTVFHQLTYTAPRTQVCSPLEIIYDTPWSSYLSGPTAVGRLLDVAPFFSVANPPTTMQEMAVVRYRIYEP